MVEQHPTIPICDYEGSDYRERFWERGGRAYEDRVERIALRRLLPPRGRRLVEIGAGFGRLADLYKGYDQVILLDYSLSMLRQARERYGDDPRFVFVAANLYQLPFVDGAFDVVTMIRVIHHVQDVPRALAEIGRVIAPGGNLILEFANKRHFKSILRYLFRRQAWSPFSPEPVEFVRLNFDFHPRWMYQRLTEAGLTIRSIRALSHFRLPLLKRFLPVGLLAAVDGVLQPTGRWWQFTPSLIVRAERPGTPPERLPSFPFRCPACGAAQWDVTPQVLRCLSCEAVWPIEEGIYRLEWPRKEGV